MLIASSALISPSAYTEFEDTVLLPVCGMGGLRRPRDATNGGREGEGHGATNEPSIPDGGGNGGDECCRHPSIPTD